MLPVGHRALSSRMSKRNDAWITPSVYLSTSVHRSIVSRVPCNRPARKRQPRDEASVAVQNEDLLDALRGRMTTPSAKELL